MEKFFIFMLSSLSIFFSPSLCLSISTHLYTGRGKMLTTQQVSPLATSGMGQAEMVCSSVLCIFLYGFFVFFLVKSIIILIKNSCFFKSSSMVPGFTSFLEKVYNVWNHNCILPLFQFCGFLGGTIVKNLLAKAGDSRDWDLVTESGWSPGGGNGNPLQYSYLENPMDEPGGL